MSDDGYVFDTSGLLDGWSRQYPVDVFPDLWDSLSDLIEDGRGQSPEEVLAEAKKRDDGLHNWMKVRKAELIYPTDMGLMQEVKLILAEHKLITKPGTGRNAADPFVIALAAISGRAVVIGEQGGSTSKPKIPSVCAAWGVECINFLEFIRREGWTFRRT